MTEDECLAVLEKYQYRIGVDNTKTKRGKARPKQEREEIKAALNTLKQLRRKGNGKRKSRDIQS